MRNKISHSIARVGIGMAIIAGLVLSAGQIFLDYQDQQDRNDVLVGHALQIASAGASQAAYEISSDEAYSVLQSLMVHEYFTQVEILSETGKRLNSISREPQPHIAEPFLAALSARDKVYELELFHQRGNLDVGKLRVSVHTATIMKDFYSRSIRLIVAGIFRSLAMAAILLYVFNDMLTRPIEEIVDKLKKIDPRDPETIKVPARIAKADDELTDLVETTNAILKASQQNLVEIENKRREADEIAEKLRQSERLSIVGKLTGGVAHDFNNILAAILGCFELLQNDRKLSDDSKKLVVMGTSATQRGAALTADLLAYSRRQPLNPESIAISDFFCNLYNLLTGALGKKYKIEFNLAKDLWRCTADVRQLEMVFLNLAINARDAMPDGGTIMIDARNSYSDREGHTFEHQPGPIPNDDVGTSGHYVCISVSDAGTGMSADVIENAIEPYFTTKEVGKGSGLGLSMVYGFITQSEGHIEISSKEGVGTTITIYLPCDLQYSSASDKSGKLLAGIVAK